MHSQSKRQVLYKAKSSAGPKTSQSGSSIQNPKSKIQNRLTAAPVCGYALK